MSGFTQLPPPGHYETVDGTPVIGWWAGTPNNPVWAVIHSDGRFVVTDAPYRLRQFKMATSENSAPDPFVDEYAQGRAQEGTAP